MHSLTVQVDGDHPARLVRSPRAGLTELIWNALDADADVVDGGLEFSTLGAVERVLVVDRGHGMSPDDVQQGFGALGGSWKRTTRTTRQQGRRLHGEQGKGRFAAFGIGDVVEWCTVHEDDPATETRIRAERHNLRRFEIITAPAEGDVGTRVFVVSVNEAAGKQLEQDSLIDTLSAEFAIYLESYRHVEISWRGQKLNPGALQVEREEYDLEVDGLDDRPQLVVIEWRRQVDRALYLCWCACAPATTARPCAFTSACDSARGRSPCPGGCPPAPLLLSRRNDFSGGEGGFERGIRRQKLIEADDAQ
ncbi:ATP-binding protein [Streptomyces sp. NPDC048251]|uniref:ATP-binding protein n=1 Tax=Streptomyces sp. NPDC048251 TaxID=3154501 RepID=UPI003417E446